MSEFIAEIEPITIKQEQEYAVSRSKGHFCLSSDWICQKLDLSTSSVGDEEDVPQCFVMLVG